MEEYRAMFRQKEELVASIEGLKAQHQAERSQHDAEMDRRRAELEALTQSLRELHKGYAVARQDFTATLIVDRSLLAS